MPKFKFDPQLRENLIDGLVAQLLEAHDKFVNSYSVGSLIGEREAEDIYNSMSSVGPNVGSELEKAAKKIIKVWEDILSVDIGYHEL